MKNSCAIALATFLLSTVFMQPAEAQVFKWTREEMIRYTPKNPFDRFPDGRPKVPDAILEKVKGLSAEEVFGIERRGFPYQFSDHWQIVHPDKKLVGRAVTLQLLPIRRDVADVDHTGLPSTIGYGEHLTHQSALDLLQPGDVIVVDAHTIDGGIIGDNLAYYIWKRTGAGFVIDGQIRDLDGIREFPVAGYYREAVPSFLTNCMVGGINVPIQIGKVTVMPGDVVFGDTEGVYFIPPSIVKQVVDAADTVHIHDEWTKKKFDENKYKSTDIYPAPHAADLKKEYQEYLKQKLAQQGK
jgi:4-hydroxy-4-methyl-2-oxoglutarate aldolase